jgi:hypothetical protein
MTMPFAKTFYLATTALALTLASTSADATPLPLPGNFNFLLSSSGGAPKEPFQTFNPTDWSYGNQGGLVFIASSSTAKSNPASPCGSTYLQTYGCPSTLSLAGGYNVVEADGNPLYESGFGATVKNLIPGTTYTLSFYQAASQQTTFSGATTNQWVVALGKVGSNLFSAKSSAPNTPNSHCGTNCVYTDTDSAASVTASQLMHVASGGIQDWEYVSVNLKAKSATETLSFLAWGNNGNTTNMPPMAFLTGAQAAPGQIPEPASLTVLGVGLAGVGGIVRRRRKLQAASKAE